VPARHGANALKNYVETHETVMEQFRREGFVESDTIDLVSAGNGLFHMEGEIRCLGGLVCTVEKWLETVDATDIGNPKIQTFRYSYNVSVSGMHNVFRYDNADHYRHADAHHRHAFDWQTGAQTPGSPAWIGKERWPVLGDVVREMSDWYWGHEAVLPRRA
jgi:hypothetical protein